MTATTDIKFDAARHTYMVAGCRLPSVTTLVNKLKPKFDAPFMAGCVAQREGRTVAEVLADWDEKRQDAFCVGRECHSFIEAALLGRQLVEVSEQIEEIVAWQSWWESARQSLTVRHVELMVADAKLGVAGTMDALLASSKTALDHVFDWKTGGKFESENRYGERLLPPFDDLWNCELACYSLQVSTYRLILERQGRRCGESWVLHLGPQGTYQPWRALDLRARAEAWLLSMKGRQ